jgi:hypothetical protein
MRSVTHSPRRLQMTNKTDLTAYIASKIEASKKTEKEIARDAGITSNDFVSMIEVGNFKIPMDTVLALADALGASRAEVVRRVLEADYPDVLEVIDALLPDMPTTEDEIALIRSYRFLKGRGIIDDNGCELRGLGRKGRESGWATISRKRS